MTTASSTDEFDSPWKGILDKYFQEFMELLFPGAAAQIDWGRGYENLDKEFQQIVRDAEIGKRLADKLVKVWLQDGQEMVVYVHTEIQGTPDKDFERRMYTYHYRIFDRYDGHVVSLAVLADEGNTWSPRQFKADLWGCRVQFDFPSVKLQDFRSPAAWNRLEASNNLFAKIVIAHLKTQDTQKDVMERKQSKMTLTKSLYRGGFTKQQILDIFWFIDWVMHLPDEIAEQFDYELQEFEKENKMTYVTTMERRGIQQGMQQGMQKGAHQTLREDVYEILELRFQSVPYTIKEQLAEIKNTNTLRGLHRLAVQAKTIEDFTKEMPNGM